MTRNFNDPDDVERRSPRSSLSGVEFCTVTGCRAYLGNGRYSNGPSIAHVCFTKANGERVRLCGYHYLVGGDIAGITVKAKLLKDPESIPSQLKAQLQRENERDRHDAEVADDLRALDQLEANDRRDRDE